MVRRNGASMGAQETLAKASEAVHPREALEVYAERAARVDRGGSLHHAGGGARGLAVEADPTSLTFGLDALPGAAVIFLVGTQLS